MRPDPELFGNVRKLLEHPAISGLLAEHSCEMLYLQDDTGRMISVSPSVESLTGYHPDEYMVCAPDLLDLNSQRTRKAMEMWSDAKRTETGTLIGPYLLDITHKDGRRRTHEVRERWFEHEGKRFLAGIAHDVTDQAVSEHVFEHVLDNAGLANYFGDFTPEGPRHRYLSPGFADLYGVANERVYENPSSFLERVHPDDIERVRELVGEVFTQSGRLQWNMRYRVCHPDKGTRWLSDRGFIEPGHDGKPRHWIGVGEDITQLVQEEEQARRAEERLAQAHKLEAVGQLAAGVAHSYSNLLLAIESYLELARNTLEPTHPAVEALDRIQDSAEQARGISSSLLSFSKQQPPDLQIVDLSQCIESAARLLQRSIPTRIRLVRHVEPGLRVRGDQSTLTQVVLNLAINARDAIPDRGEIEIRLESQGDLARLSVSDDGHGMDADTLRHAFEPFFTTKPDGDGTGLGLSVSRGIVEGLGGTIEASSEPGRGSRFDITIPITVDDETDHASDRLEGEHTAVVLHTPGLASRVIQSTLHSLGFTPGEIDSPDALLSSLERVSPDLIVLEDAVFAAEPDLLRSLVERADSSRFVLITDPQGDTERLELPEGVVELPRPYTMADLSAAVTGDPV